MLHRHAFRTLPDPYLALYQKDGDLPRYTEAVTGFFEAAFGPSLWSSLDHARGSGRQAQIAADFGRRLAAAVAANPNAAACTWHTVALDIEGTTSRSTLIVTASDRRSSGSSKFKTMML